MHSLIKISCILSLFLFTTAHSREHRKLRNVALTYCVAFDGASKDQLKAAINYVCSKAVDCEIIKPGGPCYSPNTLVFHASAVMNAYLKANRAQGPACAEGPLKNIGLLTFSDPSQGSCIFN